MNATDKRTAIVTGAGSGIGRATALALLADGWNVALLGRRIEPLRAIANLDQHAAKSIAIRCDVTDQENVRSAFQQTAERFKRIDLLFNNAGVSNPAGPFEKWTPEQWKAVVDTNLNGMFFCLQEAFRVMSGQNPCGGRIINNGSISASAPRPNSIAYTATKHAVKGMTKAASLDGRKHNIAVGQIDVGNAQSSLSAYIGDGTLQASGDVAVEPMIDVAIVGESIRYMASLPLEANVLFHTVMATKMPFVGRG